MPSRCRNSSRRQCPRTRGRRQARTRRVGLLVGLRLLMLDGDMSSANTKMHLRNEQRKTRTLTPVLLVFSCCILQSFRGPGRPPPRRDSPAGRGGPDPAGRRRAVTHPPTAGAGPGRTPPCRASPAAGGRTREAAAALRLACRPPKAGSGRPPRRDPLASRRRPDPAGRRAATRLPAAGGRIRPAAAPAAPPCWPLEESA